MSIAYHKNAHHSTGSQTKEKCEALTVQDVKAYGGAGLHVVESFILNLRTRWS
jgi:hypothetical protein